MLLPSPRSRRRVDQVLPLPPTRLRFRTIQRNRRASRHRSLLALRLLFQMPRYRAAMLATLRNPLQSVSRATLATTKSERRLSRQAPTVSLVLPNNRRRLSPQAEPSASCSHKSLALTREEKLERAASRDSAPTSYKSEIT